MRALVDNPSWLPSLKLLGLKPGLELGECLICKPWYGTENTDGDQEVRAYITQHEYDRLCRLSRIRRIEFKSDVDCLPDTPVDGRGQGLNMRRIEKINARRSWYDGDRDENIGLFELSNT